jgi:carbon-monoxide dehydrogenase medium subunit
MRNIATLVGNVVTAQPAADGAIPLVALDGELKVVSMGRERWVALEEAYRGVGRSEIDPTQEIATELRFRKLGRHGASRFFRMARRKALALPILNGAIAVAFNPSMNRIAKARIAIGPVADKPFRSRDAEACLESKEICSELISEVARISSEEAKPRSSLLRGSDVYRKEMLRLYLTRTLQKVIDEVKIGKPS